MKIVIASQYSEPRSKYTLLHQALGLSESCTRNLALFQLGTSLRITSKFSRDPYMSEPLGMLKKDNLPSINVK